MRTTDGNPAAATTRARAARARMRAANEVRHERDIARRMREQHKRAHRMFKLISDNAHDAYFMADANARILYANRTACEQTGYSVAELTRRTIMQIDPQTTLKRYRENFAMARHHRISFETIVRRKDGGILPVEVGVTTFVMDGKRYAFGIARDITERKQAAREAEQLNRDLQRRIGDLQTLLDVAPLAIAVAHDPKGDMVTVNPACSAMLEVPNGINVSLRYPNRRKMPFRFARDGRLLKDGETPLQQTAATGRVNRGVRFDLVRKDGRRFHLSVFTAPLYDENQKVRGALALLVDITEARLSEEKIRFLNRELEQKAALASSLSRHILEAQEAERRRVARELHDGVNQILSAAKFKLEAAARQRDTPDRMRAAVEQTDAYLRNAILEISRISHNLHPAVLDDLGLEAAIRGLCQDFAERTGIRCETKIGRLPALGRDDIALAIFRMVQEGLSNIEKHAAAKNATVALARTRNRLSLTIQDDGKGFRPSTSRRGRQRGGGLGLVSMRERAILHGGSLAIQSQRGCGATLTVELPLETCPVKSNGRMP